MIPIKDDNPTLSTPWAVYILIGLNAMSWIWLQGFGMNPVLPISVCRFGAIPGVLLGSLGPGDVIPLAPGITFPVKYNLHWLTVLTHMFMHGGWLHILGNMWFLYLFGDNVEDAMGSARFFIFYMTCGFISLALQTFMNPGSAMPMVGASGAISGVMGAYIILYPRAPVHMLLFFGFFFTRVVVPAFFMLGYWFIIQLLGGFFTLGSSTGGVAFWAHVGGFIAGTIFIYPFCDPHRRENCRARRGVLDVMFKKVK
jgi:membrane associated rhomboid family serine protease